MSWCFAVVNNRLAEIYFEKKKSKSARIWGHCYVNKKEFSTKQEKKWMAEDTKKCPFAYKNGKYREKLNSHFFDLV